MEAKAFTIVSAAASPSSGGASMRIKNHQEDSPPPGPSRDDRRRGAILGLAIGDALGAAVEFKPPGTFPEVTGYPGRRAARAGARASGPTTPAWPWRWPTASPTVGWDLNDQARRYLAWWQHGALLGQRPAASTSASRRRGRCSDSAETGDARDLRRPVRPRQRQRVDHAAGPGADRLCRPLPRPARPAGRNA